MDINELRSEIDKVDSELLKLFARRMELSREIALWKKAEGKAIFDPVREQEKLSAIAEKSG
ncbi:MAG: chorismate mutase, partial [Oscillospiraceae bacterium]|nr:chorismate mutase [Oscillospiraceae bacterium]